MILNKLRKFQISLRLLLKKFINVNAAIILVMLNTGLLASFQKQCTNSVIDSRLIVQLIINSLLFFAILDFDLKSFAKMILAGAISHIATGEFISLYMRYVAGYGTICDIPLYVSGWFNQLVVTSVFLGILYYIFTGNRENSIQDHFNNKIDSDFN